MLASNNWGLKCRQMVCHLQKRACLAKELILPCNPIKIYDVSELVFLYGTLLFVILLFGATNLLVLTVL